MSGSPPLRPSIQRQKTRLNCTLFAPYSLADGRHPSRFRRCLVLRTMTTIQLIAIALAFVPTILVLAIVFTWFAIQVRRTRAPIKDKLLRAPGESLRRQIEKFDNDTQMNLCLLLLLYGPGCLLLLATFAKLRLKSPHLLAEIIVFSALLLIVTLVFAWKIIKVLTHQRNLSLGFRGERAVGEELNKLMLDGCFVFHDVPGDADWNVDHVVVASTGVFAIETKTRRKGTCPKGKRDYEVLYDGKTLEYPHCKDSHGIEQVKANAKWIGRHLSNALAEEVRAIPILTLPGWFVTSRVKPGKGELLVLSHKQIRSAILNGRERVFDEKRMRQIAYQLEQRCRDVEF